jgi:diguanylate cyclase (GGDEF)-like protein
VPLSVVAAVTLDAIAIGAAVGLVFTAATDAPDRAVALGVVVAIIVGALIGSVDVTPSTRPGSTGRLLGRELVVVSLALLALPLALMLSLRDDLAASTVVLAAIVVVALVLRMALLTRRADMFGRAQAGRVAQLSRLALHDPLTGLPNRTLLEDRLAMAVAGQRRTNSVLAVLFCDLDKFKLINDTIGHDGGDAVLVVIAERLRGAVRATDTVSRIGGDEFVVLCPQFNNESELTELVERLLAVLAEPMAVAGHEIVISGSVGVAVVKGGTAPASLADLVREADAAMYRAKANGRNRWERLEPEKLEPTPRYASVRSGGDEGSWRVGASSLAPSGD